MSVLCSGPFPSLDVWTISCRSGWAAWQAFGGTSHRQQSPGKGAADRQGPKVMRDMVKAGIWMSWFPGLAQIQVPTRSLGPCLWAVCCCLAQVNEMLGEASSRGSRSSSVSWCPGRLAVITGVYLPLGSEVRLSQAVQAGRDTSRVPPRALGAAGLAVNSSWGPGRGLGTEVFRGDGGVRVQWGIKVRLGRTDSGLMLAWVPF